MKHFIFSSFSLGILLHVYTWISEQAVRQNTLIQDYMKTSLNDLCTAASQVHVFCFKDV